MNDGGPLITACRLDDAGTIAVELYIWNDDDTCGYYPSLHNGTIDADVLAEQLRTHPGQD